MSEPQDTGDAEKLIARIEAEIEKQRQIRGDYLDYGKPDTVLVDCLAALRRVAEPVDRVERLTEALTPSADTKAAYIGEFHVDVGEWDGDEQRERVRKVAVPWTTIKAIMAAIRARAALEDTRDGN